MAKTAKELLTDAKLDHTYWGKKIIAIEARGNSTREDIRLATGWQTCACGKQDSRIPREQGEEKAPLDNRLYELGIQFCGAVDSNDPVAAANTLIKIELRAAKVLAKVLAKEAAVAEGGK